MRLFPKDDRDIDDKIAIVKRMQMRDSFRRENGPFGNGNALIKQILENYRHN